MQFGDMRKKPVPFAFIRQHADPDLCRPDTAPDVIYGVISDFGCPWSYIPLVVILLIVERCLQYPDHYRNRAGLVSALLFY